MLKKILILFLSIIFTGCTHITMNKQEKQSIKKIYINPEISQPEIMTYYTFDEDAILGPFNISFNIARGDELKKLAEENNIDIKKIIYSEFKKKLIIKNNLKIAKSPVNNPILKINILIYGISIPKMLSNDFIPLLTVQANLMKNDKVIWQDSESAPIFGGNLPRYKMQDILNRPKNLYVMWEQAADDVVNKLLADMGE